MPETATMSVVEHLTELRNRLITALVATAAGAVVCFVFFEPIMAVMIRPYEAVTDKALVSSFLTLSSIPYYLFALLTWLYLTVIFEVPFISDTGYDMVVLRYNSNGTMDASFGTNGTVTVPFAGNSFDVARSVALQADGKIVVGGSTSGAGTGNDFALVRLNSNGTLDTSFGSFGKVRTAVSSVNDDGYALAIQPDGKIVLVGAAMGLTNDFAIVRYEANGTPDLTFDGDGEVLVNFNHANSANAVAVQPDGKILVAGQVGGDRLPRATLARGVHRAIALARGRTRVVRAQRVRAGGEAQVRAGAGHRRVEALSLARVPWLTPWHVTHHPQVPPRGACSV